jgi:hypothetical protein
VTVFWKFDSRRRSLPPLQGKQHTEEVKKDAEGNVNVLVSCVRDQRCMRLQSGPAHYES